MSIATLAVSVLCVLAAENKQPSEREIVVLIDQLVSPNKAPKEDGPDVDYPKGFDRAAQKRVYKAWTKLRAIGLPAFPHLHARLDDQRYCFTRDTGPAESNFSVGNACYLVIRDHLQPYGRYTKGEDNPRARPYRPDYCDHHNLDQTEAFQTWWKAHKNKSMRRIQIEVLEWTIEREKEQPKSYSAEEGEYLRKTLKTLRAADKPLPPHFPFSR